MADGGRGVSGEIPDEHPSGLRVDAQDDQAVGTADEGETDGAASNKEDDAQGYESDDSMPGLACLVGDEWVDWEDEDDGDYEIGEEEEQSEDDWEEDDEEEEDAGENEDRVGGEEEEAEAVERDAEEAVDGVDGQPDIIGKLQPYSLHLILTHLPKNRTTTRRPVITVRLNGSVIRNGLTVAAKATLLLIRRSKMKKKTSSYKVKWSMSQTPTLRLHNLAVGSPRHQRPPTKEKGRLPCHRDPCQMKQRRRRRSLDAR